MFFWRTQTNINTKLFTVIFFFVLIFDIWGRNCVNSDLFNIIIFAFFFPAEPYVSHFCLSSPLPLNMETDASPFLVPLYSPAMITLKTYHQEPGPLWIPFPVFSLWEKHVSFRIFTLMVELFFLAVILSHSPACCPLLCSETFSCMVLFYIEMWVAIVWEVAAVRLSLL